MHEYVETLMRELGCTYAEAHYAACRLWETDEGLSPAIAQG